jgi:hypothetical protein
MIVNQLQLTKMTPEWSRNDQQAGGPRRALWKTDEEYTSATTASQKTR